MNIAYWKVKASG